MPEPPDFEQIASRLLDSPGDYPARMEAIVEQLRHVWNARGAAEADLRKAAETVLEQFTRDESQGYHSRDRQYAIDVLGRALNLTAP